MTQIKFAKDFNLATFDVPAELHYVLAYPFPAHVKDNILNVKIQPNTLTFRSLNITIAELYR